MKQNYYLILGFITIFGILLVSGCIQTTEAQKNDTFKTDNALSGQNKSNVTNSNVVDSATVISNVSDSNAGSDSDSTNLTDVPINKIIEAGLITHWKFDEDSGEVVQDSVNSYDGAVIGGAGRVKGKFGNAIYFDGVDDYIDLPQDAIDTIGAISNAGTIAFWFNYDDVLDAQPIMPIFYIGIDDKSNDDSMFIIELGHGDIESPEYGSGTKDKKLYNTWVKDSTEPVLCYDSNENLQEGVWYHFALVVGPNGNTGYLNGVELKNRDYNFGGSSAKLFLGDIPIKKKFTFGYGRTQHYVSPKFVYYKGYLDDVRIYDRSLSSLEIAAIMENK